MPTEQGQLLRRPSVLTMAFEPRRRHVEKVVRLPTRFANSYARVHVLTLTDYGWLLA